jgi:hypothetical protein
MLQGKAYPWSFLPEFVLDNARGTAYTVGVVLPCVLCVSSSGRRPAAGDDAGKCQLTGVPGDIFGIYSGPAGQCPLGGSTRDRAR